MADTVSITGTLGAAQQAVTLSVASMGGVGIQIQGSFTGTITFEASVQGLDFQALLMTPTNSSTAVTTATAAGIWSGSAVGMTTFRARMSAFSVGKATVLLRAEQASPGGSGGGGGGGAVTIADGADVTEGAIADVAVTGDNAGTISAKLRGLDKIWADVWDSVNHWIRISAASLPLPTGAATDAALKPALTVTALQVTSSGDTTLISSGTRKVHRVEMSNSSTTAAVTAGLKIASVNGGSTFAKKYLPTSGGLGVFTFPGGYLQATSEAVSVNLSGVGQVEVTAYYE